MENPNAFALGFSIFRVKLFKLDEAERISFEYSVYNSSEELPHTLKNLLNDARKAATKAYAPYSKFKVGAAILLENNEVILGNNQENASFPAGMCAERVALFFAGANYPNTPIKAIAVTAFSEEKPVINPAAPCGICRQAIAEYEQKQESKITVVMAGQEGEVYVCDSLQDLLPMAFNNSFLADS